MYCPQCASPIDGVKFCRSCGANVSLIPQALTGRLQADTDESEEWSPYRLRRRSRQQPVDRFITTFFTGIAFLIATFVISFRVPSGIIWGWAMLIPAFACFGEAFAQYLKYRDQRRQVQAQISHYNTQRIEPHQPAEISQPSSIAEPTTKHLDSSQQRE